MNAGMIPRVILDDMAKFPVGNIMVEPHEITLLGVSFNDVLSLSRKDFWKEYRKCSKKVKHIE